MGFPRERNASSRRAGGLAQFTSARDTRAMVLGRASRGHPQKCQESLEMEVHVRPRTFGARLLSPLIALMSRMMVKSCAKDLGDIAAAAERDAKG